MKTLASYISGSWVEGKGSTTTLLNPATEEPLAQVSTEGLDLGAALDFGRRVGGPAVRALSFAERGAALKKMSELLVEHREELIGLAIANGGNTRGDSKFDIDGAAATLAAYADLGASLGDAKLLIDGEGIQLGRSPRFHGQHVLTPRAGVAVHINAYNFPAWGMELRPKTGRTHQLRVHASHPSGLDAPIVGDPLYGRRGPRLLLHAEALRLRHPRDGRVLELESPAPF